MHRICNTLAEAGWRVTLVGRRRRSSQSLPKFRFRTRRLNCFFERGKMFYAVLNFRLFWYLLLHKADVICAIDLDTWPACRWASRLKRTRLAYDAHELFTDVPEVVRRPRIQRVWLRIERKACTRSDIRYTVSQSIADHFKEKYGAEFHVIRNMPVAGPQPLKGSPALAVLPRLADGQALGGQGASTGIQQTTGNRQPATVLYQGALNEGRCLEELLHAMTQLDCKLQLAGEGDLSRQLRALCEDLSLQERVTFLGWLEPDELREVTGKATVGFNLLEDTGLSYQYSLGNKFFDYIHAGIPQLCADFPEYRRINEQFEVAVLTNGIKPEAIASQIRKMLGDPSLLERLRANCQRARSQLNWEKEQAKLLTLFASIDGE